MYITKAVVRKSHSVCRGRDDARRPASIIYLRGIRPDPGSDVPAAFCHRLSLFARQRDGVDMAAVIRLGAVGGAAEAEKSLRLRIGAEPDVVDLLHAGAV
jgi:hypothetical protein